MYGAYENKASVRGCGNAFEGEAIGFAVATASDYDCTNGSGLSKSLGGKIRVLHRLWMSRTNPLTLTKAKETGGGAYSLVVVFRLL